MATVSIIRMWWPEHCCISNSEQICAQH